MVSEPEFLIIYHSQCNILWTNTQVSDIKIASTFNLQLIHSCFLLVRTSASLLRSSLSHALFLSPLSFLLPCRPTDRSFSQLLLCNKMSIFLRAFEV